MYYLYVFALFKNEAHCIKEWIDHYIFHGVEHFYLLDDESDDNYHNILDEYINKGLITLIKIKWDRYKGRQKDIYNNYMLPLIKETQWLLICDLDEFVWSPQTINLTTILNTAHHLAVLQVTQTLFGSNNHISQPSSLVKSFTKRREYQCGLQRTCGYKYFINSTYPFKELNVHYAIPEIEYDEKNRWIILDDSYFILNHYCCQSRDYFEKKCKRTDVNVFKEINIDDFPEFDINEVDDFRLYEQNKSLYI